MAIMRKLYLVLEVIFLLMLGYVIKPAKKNYQTEMIVFYKW